jgi:uncharacterized protein YdcH (DUF465 family)
MLQEQQNKVRRMIDNAISRALKIFDAKYEALEKRINIIDKKIATIEVNLSKKTDLEAKTLQR